MEKKGSHNVKRCTKKRTFFLASVRFSKLVGIVYLGFLVVLVFLAILVSLVILVFLAKLDMLFTNRRSHPSTFSALGVKGLRSYGVKPNA